MCRIADDGCHIGFSKFPKTGCGEGDLLAFDEDKAKVFYGKCSPFIVLVLVDKLFIPDEKSSGRTKGKRTSNHPTPFFTCMSEKELDCPVQHHFEMDALE